MLSKLAFRNVRRQISSYIIYFITVVFTVSLMFAANNILLSSGLKEFVKGADAEYFNYVLAVVIGIITFTVGFIICYATAFLLRKRKKELGTYLLLGIKRSAVLRVFVIENLLIAACSFALGCLIGLLVFQIFNSIVCSIMGNNFPPLRLTPNSLWFTFLQWAAIALAAILYSGYILGKSKISELLKDRAAARKLPKKPLISMVAAILMLVIIVLVCVIEIWCFSDIFGFMVSKEQYFTDAQLFIIMPTGIAVLAAAIFLFYFFSRSFYLSGLTSDKRLRGSNAFHYRQMSGALSRNAAILGTIAVLLSFSFFFSNLSFSMRYVQIEEVKQNMPFDIIGSWTTASAANAICTPEEVVAQAKKYSEITFRQEYGLYDAGEDIVGSNWNENTTALKIDEINPVLKKLKSPGYTIADDEFYLFVVYDEQGGEFYYGESSYYKRFKEGDTINVFGKELKFKGVKHEPLYWLFTGEQFFIAVSDSLIPTNEWEQHRSSTYLALNTKDYVPQDFMNALNPDVTDWYNIRNRHLAIDAVNLDSSILIVSALYLGVTFMFIAMALLSLKVMSDADLDKRRYLILNMLGTSEKHQRKIMLRQILTFFAVPMAIPLFMTVPAIIMCALWSYFLLGLVQPTVYLVGITIPLLYTAIYCCYFAATYYLSIKSNIKPLEKPRVKIL